MTARQERNNGKRLHLLRLRTCAYHSNVWAQYMYDSRPSAYVCHSFLLRHRSSALNGWQYEFGTFEGLERNGIQAVTTGNTNLLWNGRNVVICEAKKAPSGWTAVCLPPSSLSMGTRGAAVRLYRCEFLARPSASGLHPWPNFPPFLSAYGSDRGGHRNGTRSSTKIFSACPLGAV